MLSSMLAMAGGGGGQGANPMMNIIFLGVLFVIFWVFLIQPQRKQQKEHENLIKNLGKGDKIVTQGGIHGTITIVRDNTVVVRVDDQTKLEFDKQSVLRVISKKNDK